MITIENGIWIQAYICDSPVNKTLRQSIELPV